jgi:hypothetical protein
VAVDTSALLLACLVDVALEALEGLKPAEKHQLYRILKLRVVTSKDGIPEMSGAFRKGLGVCEWKSQYRVVSR